MRARPHDLHLGPAVNTSHADDSVDATIDPADERPLDDDPVGNERPGSSAPARGTAAPLEHPGRRLVIAAAALALVNVVVLAVGGTGWAATVVHVATAALAVAGWIRMHTDAAPGDAWRLLALSTAALGPIGVIGAGALALLLRGFTRGDAQSQPSWSSLLTEDEDAQPFERAEANVEATLGRRAAVVPFADVLAQGTLEQKQEMVSVIAANFQPSFARALRAAMNDTEPAVRMMAAAAAARIESRFLDASMALETQWADEPSNAHRALELARHYDAFAATDLLDESRADEARSRALEMYQLAARDLPRDSTIAQATVRLLLKLGREEEAIGLYHQRMDDGSAPPALASWYLECLYRRHRFGELRRHAAALAHRVRDLDMLHPRSVDAMQLWALGPPKYAMVPVDVLLDDVDEVPPPEQPATREERRQRVKFELPYFRPNYPV
jgi:polysaccharide biosynthesis protein PelE